MNPHSPQLDFTPDLALLSLLLILVFVVGVIVAVMFELRRSPPQNRVLSKTLAMFGAVAVAMVVFGGVFLSRTRVDSGPIKWQWKDNFAEQPTASLRPDPPKAVTETPPSDTNALPNSPNAELPEWTRQVSRIDGANTLVVVKSGRFATLEEAELHAFDEAGKAAARHFFHLDPRGVGQCDPTQRELVRQQAIQERFEEITRHDFGNMKDYPMHQVWLQLKLSPPLGQQFAKPWRQVTVASRLHALTVWSIWGTVTAALLGFSLRLDAAWQGRRRAAVAGTTAALVLASLAFIVAG
jgi:hypothetical protein